MKAAELKEYLEQAEHLFAQGNPAAALAVLENLPWRAKVAQPVIALKTNLLLATREWAKAELMAQSGTRCAPGAAEIWYCLAVAQVKMGKTTDARSTLDRVFTLDESLRSRALADEAFRWLQ